MRKSLPSPLMAAPQRPLPSSRHRSPRLASSPHSEVYSKPLNLTLTAYQRGSHLALIELQDQSVCAPLSFKPSLGKATCQRAFDGDFLDRSSVKLRLNGALIGVSTSFKVGTTHYLAGNFGIAAKDDSAAFYTITGEASGLGDNIVSDLAISGSNFIAGTGSGVSLSADSGATWLSFATIEGEEIVRPKVHVDASSFYVASASALYHSDDFGSSWSSFYFPGAASQGVVDITVFSGKIVVAGLDNLYTSDDGINFSSVPELYGKKLLDLQKSKWPPIRHDEKPHLHQH